MAHPERGRIKPYTYAGVVVVLFASTVVSLALKAGTGTAVLVAVVAIALAAIFCGLCGAVLAAKETLVEVPVAHRNRLDNFSDPRFPTD
jgi:uncharacterized membrane protein YobD (UPF0266 family)